MNLQTHRLGGIRLPRAFSSQRVHLIVKTVLRAEKVKGAGEVNVIFVDRQKIRRLNRQFLQETGNTDVIAFPQEPQHGRIRKLAGDIFICVPVARDNARRFRETFERELTRLVVHGTLHLLGYADEPAAAQKKMWSRQEPLVQQLVPV